MGERINYLVQHGPRDGVVCAVLYSNSVNIDALGIFEAVARKSAGPNQLISELLLVQYGDNDPLKRKGLGVFTFDCQPYDHEQVARVWWDEAGKVVISRSDSLDGAPILKPQPKHHGPSCRRCENELRIDGFCKDEACPYSDWPQEADLLKIETEDKDQYEATEGLARRRPVDAEAESDDGRAKVDFDAGPYFWWALQQGQLSRILEAMVYDPAGIDSAFGGNEAADEVARFFSEDETKAVFDATGEDANGDMVGFECYVDEQMLKAWIEKNAPQHLDRLDRPD